MSKGQFLVTVLAVLVGTIAAEELRAYNNPLNNRAVDLFLVADEASAYMNVMQLGLLKTSLNNIVTDLNPTSSNPQFGLFFYGAAASVDVVVPFSMVTAAQVKAKLDLKQYTTTQANPSTLSAALERVKSSCALSCRPGVPRVTVVIASNLDSSSEASVRSLERDTGMTVIVVGIGYGASPFNLNTLASHPARFYGIPVASLYELILASTHISSVISDVPRLIGLNSPLHISGIAGGVYHNLQIDTLAIAAASDMIVMFASNCPTCTIYGSLSEPNPTSGNTAPNTDRRGFFAASGYPNGMHYFRIPRGTSRFFFSLIGSGMPATSLLFDVFPIPAAMALPANEPKEVQPIA